MSEVQEPHGPQRHGIIDGYDYWDHARRAWDEFRECSFQELQLIESLLVERIKELVKWKNTHLVPARPDESSKSKIKMWRQDMAHCEFSILRLHERLDILRTVRDQLLEYGRIKYSKADRSARIGRFGVPTFDELNTIEQREVAIGGRDAPRYARAMLAAYQSRGGEVDSFTELYRLLSEQAHEDSGALLDSTMWEKRHSTVRRALRRKGIPFNEADIHSFMRALANGRPHTPDT